MLYDIRLMLPNSTDELRFQHPHNEATVNTIQDEHDIEVMYYWRCGVCHWVSEVVFFELVVGRTDLMWSWEEA